MNIVQLHDRTRFWTDTVGSARFSSDDIDHAINNAINEIVSEKYDHSRMNHYSDTFQKTQRLRDELGDLVKELDTDGTLTLTTNSGYVLVSNFPSDYMHLLAIALYVGSSRYCPDPLTYDRKNIISRNPFRRVQQAGNGILHFIEDESGIKIYHPFETAEPTKVEINYLSRPVDVFYGYEKDHSDVIGLHTDFITSLTPTSYDGVDYVSGTALTTNGIVNHITYGLAVVDYVNPSLKGFLYEEVARRAALNCLLSAGNFEKYKTLKAEVIAL